jgi:hypothetical protein
MPDSLDAGEIGCADSRDLIKVIDPVREVE